MRRLSRIAATVMVLLLGRAGMANPTTDTTTDVESRVASYVAAFNRRDIAAVAEHWSERGEYVLSGGAPIIGREAIASALEKMLTTEDKFQLTVSGQKFRAVSGDVVIEEGIATLVSEAHGTESASYLAVHTKRDGNWYRDTVREVAISQSSSMPDPQSLKSLLGEWNYESDSLKMTVTSDWKYENRFIKRAFWLQDSNGQTVMATEFIGWDPAAKLLRSWSFDSQGGFERAVWHRDGDRWLIKADAVLPNGISATEQRSLSIDPDGNLRSQCLEHQVGGRLMPGSDPITLVRQTSDSKASE